MKIKKIIMLIALIMLLAIVATPAVLASEDYYSVSDAASVLTQEQKDELNKRADAITENYKCEVVAVIIDDPEEDDTIKCAKEIYEYCGYGYGSDKSGVILLLNMADYNYAWCTYGYGQTVFTEFVMDAMLNEHILPLLEEDNFYEAFSTYLDMSESFLILRKDDAPSSDDDLFSYVVDKTTLAPRGNNYIIDETGTLTGAQIENLNIKAAALSEKRECGVYVWIVDLVPEKYARTVDDLEGYVDAFYERYDLGWGDDNNGMVLLLEIGDIPGERDYLLNTHGSCTTFFNNDRREKLLDDKIVPLFREAFSNGNFYKVADVFLDQIENEYVTNFIVTLGLKLAAVILLPMLIALIVCSSWKAQMKTAKIARTADNYIPEGGFKLTGKTDMFLYRTTMRTKIERESSSSSGGGGSRSSSSGRSSGGKV